jgi:Xaa-Pro dipeptidase
VNHFRGFDRSEYETRQTALRDQMARRGMDALLVSAPENTYYLSGYQTKSVSTFQFLIVTAGEGLHLFTRQMEYRNAADAQASGGLDDYGVYQDDEDPLEVARSFLARHLARGATVGIELGSASMPALRAQELTRDQAGIEWVDASTMVDRIRLVKSPAELAALHEAGRVGDRIADSVVSIVAPGVSENDLSAQALGDLPRFGSEYPGSWPNLMIGARTGMIHAAWGGTALKADDHLIMEITGVRGRYHAPSMRTVVVGKPDPSILRGAEALVAAQAAAVDAIEPGRPARVINEAASAVLNGMDHGLSIARRSGYSLGIGFPPSWGAQWQLGLNSVLEEELRIGMAFHVVCVGHLPDGKAVSIGCTVTLEDSGPVRVTRGGLFRV